MPPLPPLFAAGEGDGHGATQDGHIGRCRRARDKAAKGGCSACGERPHAGEDEWHCLFLWRNGPKEQGGVRACDIRPIIIEYKMLVEVLRYK